MGNVATCCAEERDKDGMKGNADSAKYERAVATENVVALVGLLSSEQPVKIEFLHPWAKKPTTVGAMAGMQLTVFLANPQRHAGIKDKLKELGAIKMIVDFLKGSEDRVHTALLIFSYLTVLDGDVPHVINCTEIYNHGGLPLLIQQFDSPVEGARFAVADVCNMICAASPQYKKEFVNSGGLEKIVNGIQGSEDSSLVYIDYLEELISDPTGKPVHEFVNVANQHSAYKKIQPYLEGSDEAKEASERVLALLK